MNFFATAKGFCSIGAVILLLKMYLICIIYFDLPLYEPFDYIQLFLSCLSSVAVLFVLLYLFARKLRAGAYLILHIIITGILYGNLLYFRFYIDFVTLPILFQFKNVGGLSQSTAELMDPLDLLLFADVVILLLWWIFKRPHSLPFKWKRKGILTVSTALLIAINVGCSFIGGGDQHDGSYNRSAMVSTLGPVYYHGYDIYQTARAELSSTFATEQDYKKAAAYLEAADTDITSEYFGVAKGKNVILINLESTQQFVIGREVKGEAITPFLNSLMGESFYFDQIYHQTAQGKTSDAEFMFDQSFYPLTSGSVYVRRPENEFIAMPEILSKNGYHSASFHGNVGSFWNREEAYDAFGYDDFFSKDSYQVSEENSINYGIKDKAFLEQSMPYLEKLKQPFYSKFLLLTNHFPFLLDEEDIFIEGADTGLDVVDRYFQTVRYEDEALKEFFGELKRTGLYEDSIIVLVGDHYGISENYYDGVASYLDEDLSTPEELDLQRVPLIIHVPGQKGETFHSPGGQIDIQPTILHLLGVDTAAYPNFGQDLLAPDRDPFVVFRDGDFVSDDVIYTKQLCYDKTSSEQTKMEKCSPYFEKRNKDLYYSDAILNGDLLRFAD
ncbi:LTA synthase family protein [Terribacillus saccharophilus]|uniref:LTA synthase family protein n=1 Tax=Terribacillus saccharophilus TaxID=361277 RepID=UPI002DC7E85A|nr:LTA synthase family protein [Terribacillus saccharophilus]MEC0290354.1 LTA synthase family protein [Terribacillus saccharophilus]